MIIDTSTTWKLTWAKKKKNFFKKRIFFLFINISYFVLKLLVNNFYSIGLIYSTTRRQLKRYHLILTGGFEFWPANSGGRCGDWRRKSAVDVNRSIK